MDKRLRIIDAQTLLEIQLEMMIWIVEGLLTTGLHILAGAPKIGKSILILGLLIAVNSGTTFLGQKTQKCGVLYLCLEDTLQRLQRRLQNCVDESKEDFKLCLSTKPLGEGLIESLEDYLEQYPSTKLIVIDTLQVIRQSSKDNSYSMDYQAIGTLKSFADRNRIALVLVHHTRKMGDSDIFNMVSGTNGITGAADTTMVLHKDSRTSNNAKLSVVGRDVEQQEYKLRFESTHWELVERTSTEELVERDVPGSVISALDFISARSSNWSGTATELKELIRCEESPNVLSKYLNEHREFLIERGVEYRREAKHNNRVLHLLKIPLRDGRNDSDDNNDTLASVVGK